MPDIERFALILNVVRGLNKAGSWTGKTHVIKTLYLASTKAALPFDFVLFKHGPYSFDANEDVEVMSAVGLLRKRSTPPYGVKLSPGRFANAAEGEGILDSEVTRVVTEASELVGDRDVVTLETLATAMWVYSRYEPASEADWRNGVKQLKPHLPEHKIDGEIRKLKENWL